jgi:hypothetical protein
MDRASFFIMLLMMAMSGAGVWSYYKARLCGLGDALTETLAENAKLRVAIDAAGKTEEAKKVCAVTLAALNAAYPSGLEWPKVVADKEDRRG